MEYCSKGSLKNVIHSNALIEKASFCDWEKQIVNGMYFLHRNGVVHRDLKTDK